MLRPLLRCAAVAATLLLTAATLLAAGDVEIPLGNGHIAKIDARGTVQITKGDAVVLRELFLGLWVDDQFSDQFRAAKTAGAERDGILARSGVITAGGGTARYECFIRAAPPDPTGFRDLLVTCVVDAALFPKARAALLARFPLAPYSGKSVQVETTDAGTFPDKPAANGVLNAAKDAHDLLIKSADKPLIFLGREDPGDILVQDGRKWGTDAYEAQFQLMPTRSQPSNVRAINLIISLAGRRDAVIASCTTNRAPIKDGQPTAVPRYGLLEIALDLWARHADPYDRADIDVTAAVAQPDRTVRTVHGFLYQPFDREFEKGREKLMPVGPTLWLVRFAPTQIGAHSAVVAVRARKDSLQGKPILFRALNSAAPGYVAVHKTDPRFFQFTNGDTYFAVGHNVCWGSGNALSYDYDTYFRRMGNAGENYTRVWMCSWDTGIEGDRLDNYRLDAAWRLDYILRLAEERGLYVKLCLDNENDYTDPEKRKLKLFGIWKENGGPCTTVLDFFTDPNAKAAYKRRLDYILARWGYSPNLLAWELWNEMNYIASTDPKARDVLVAWTDEMAKYVKNNDPAPHMVTTSLGLLTVWDELWQLKNLDFAQIHAYLPAPDAAKDEAEKDEVLSVLRAGARLARFGKPYLISEFGYLDLQNVNRTNEKDPTGVHIHNAVWGSLFSGVAGTPAVWWWKYVHDRNLYCHYAAAAHFLHGLDLADPDWKQIIVTSPAVRILGLRKGDAAALWIQHAGNNWYRRVIDGKPLEPLGKIRVRVPDLERGKYTVSWWDTAAGEITNYPQLATPAADDPGKFELLLEYNSGAPDIAVKVQKAK